MRPSCLLTVSRPPSRSRPTPIWQVADASYVAFLNEGSKEPANQSIIISGESGAGEEEEGGEC